MTTAEHTMPLTVGFTVRSRMLRLLSSNMLKTHCPLPRGASWNTTACGCNSVDAWQQSVCHGWRFKWLSVLIVSVPEALGGRKWG